MDRGVVGTSAMTKAERPATATTLLDDAENLRQRLEATRERLRHYITRISGTHFSGPESERAPEVGRLRADAPSPAPAYFPAIATVNAQCSFLLNDVSEALDRLEVLLS